VCAVAVGDIVLLASLLVGLLIAAADRLDHLAAVIAPLLASACLPARGAQAAGQSS
jgi:hypothetical protein